MNKKHKECVEGCKNKLFKHNCRRETAIHRSGWHFLDLECHPHDKKKFKPVAIECECGSGMPQRQSNYQDLLEWRKKNPDGEIFQIENSDELDVNKLVRQNRLGVRR